jgi:hypothetical protein
METLKKLKTNGFVGELSKEQVHLATHPGMLKFFRANIDDVRKMTNCEGGPLGFTLKVYRELLIPLFDCSLTRQCIAPEGSHRNNHRQDQSAVTLLAILAKHPCNKENLPHPDFQDHMEDLSKKYKGSDLYPTTCYSDPLELGVRQETYMPPKEMRPPRNSNWDY